MIYFIYGKDGFRSRRKLSEIVDFLKMKASDFGLFKFTGEGVDVNKFEELARTQTLFDKKHIVVCDGILENTQAKKFIEENIKSISASPNAFVFLEEEVNVETLKLFEDSAQKTQEFKPLPSAKLKKWTEDEIKSAGIAMPANVQNAITEQCGSDLWCVSKEIEKVRLGGTVIPGNSSGAEAPNPFAICDAVASKNKALAWTLFHRALFAGVAAEEVFYKILWQIKVLLLIKNALADGAKSLEKETGLKPFVIMKGSRAVEKFSNEELRDQSSRLVDLYHRARRGDEEFEIGLEKFLVGI